MHLGLRQCLEALLSPLFLLLRMMTNQTLHKGTYMARRLGWT